MSEAETAPSSSAPLRIGTLGAAAITPMALIAPARRVAEAEGSGGRRPRPRSALRSSRAATASGAST